MTVSFLKCVLHQCCPRCGEGRLFKHGFTLDFLDACPHCGLQLAEHDSGDGPIVFVMGVLCFGLGPAAVLTDLAFSPPLWVHLMTWPLLTLILVALLMRPAKALTLALQYKHRPGQWQGKSDA